MTPTDSPAIVPPNYDKIFKGYSYVAPSVLFSENVVSEDIFRIADRRPSLANLIAEKFKVRFSFPAAGEESDVSLVLA